MMEDVGPKINVSTSQN